MDEGESSQHWKAEGGGREEEDTVLQDAAGIQG